VYGDRYTDDRITVLNLSHAQRNSETIIGGWAVKSVEETLERHPEKTYCVPKTIHFIWLGDEIPIKYQNNIITFTKVNPDYEIVLWTEIITEEVKRSLTKVSIRDIRKEMENYQTKPLFGRESNVGVISDILRYEIVYRNGGVYYDTDSISLKPLQDALTHSFVSNALDPYHNICNSVFGFPKGSMFLEYVLRQLKVNINKSPNASPPGKSGPAFFSGAFVAYGDDNINMISQKDLLFQSSTALTYQTMDASWTNRE